MNSGLYELISIGARYLFALIMVIIVARAWKITIVDSRRANNLRRLSPETGVCGEFLVMSGSGRVREGMRFPVIREGLIGSSRKADIRLRCGAVHRSHAFCELTEKGLRIRACGSARIYNANGDSRKEMTIGDGGRITIGQAELMLILTDGTGADAAPERDRLFDISDEDISSMPRYAPSVPPRRPAPSPRPVYDAERAYRPFNIENSSPVKEEFPEMPDDALSSMPNYNPYTRTIDDSDTLEIPVVRAPVPEPEADLFMEDIPVTLKPESENPWDTDDDEPAVKVWDDWEDAPAKTKVKRKKYDDPFDV